MLTHHSILELHTILATMYLSTTFFHAELLTAWFLADHADQSSIKPKTHYRADAVPPPVFQPPPVFMDSKKALTEKGLQFSVAELRGV